MIKHSQLFYANPDRRNRQHNSLEGIYTPGCGLHEVNLSWSAAEYLYLVLYLNGTDFPGEALYCIRYQRFDSMVAGAYKPLMSPEVLETTYPFVTLHPFLCWPALAVCWPCPNASAMRSFTGLAVAALVEEAAGCGCLQGGGACAEPSKERKLHA